MGRLWNTLLHLRPQSKRRTICYPYVHLYYPISLYLFLGALSHTFIPPTHASVLELSDIHVDVLFLNFTASDMVANDEVLCSVS